MLALGIAQYGIQQALERGFFQLVDAGHRFTDGGVGWNTAVKQLIEADQQQRLDITVGGLEGFLQQLLGDQGQAWLPACSAEGQILGQATVTRLNLVQQRRQAAAQRSLAGQHAGQGAGGSETWVHCPSTRPGANCSRRLLYRSLKLSALPPGSCRRVRRNAPTPQATVRPDLSAARMLPGWPCPSPSAAACTLMASPPSVLWQIGQG